MVRTVFSIALFLTMGISTFGAPVNVDSLKLVADSISNDTLRGQAYLDIAWELKGSHPVEAFKYGNNALKIAEKTKYKNLEDDVLNCLGVVSKNLYNFNDALEYHLKCLHLREELKDTVGISVSYNNIGVVYKNQKNYASALNMYIKGLALLKEKEQGTLLEMFYNNIGVVYRELNQPEKAKKYFRKALVINRKKGNREWVIKNLHNLGATFLQQQNKDSARVILNKTRKLKEEHAPWDMASTLAQLGKLALLEGRTELAKGYFEQSKGYAQKHNDFESLREAYEGLEHYHIANSNYRSAYDYLRLSQQVKDSMNAALLSQRVNQIVERYDQEKTERELRYLNKEKELQQAKLTIQEQLINRQNILVFVLLSAVIVLIALLFIIYKSFKERKRISSILEKQKMELERQQKDLDAQNRKLMELNNEKKTVMSIMGHDMQSPIAQIKGFVDVLKLTNKNLTGEEKDYLEHIDQATQRVTKMISRLLNINRMEEGNFKVEISEMNVSACLHKILQQQKSKANAKKITFHNNIPEALTFRTDAEYFEHVAENLISNAIKYTPKEGNIEIELERSNNHITLVVGDDGPGIKDAEKDKLFKKYEKLSSKPTDGESSHGLGLYIVKQIVMALDGEISHGNKPDKGSVFKVSLPEK